MSEENLLFGEQKRKLDDRFRLLIPNEWTEAITSGSAEAKSEKAGSDKTGHSCILTKERPGSLSLWNADRWQKRLDDGKTLMQNKINAGKLSNRLAEVQLLGRLLSTRQRTVSIAERGRLVIPEGFREFLGVDAGSEVMIVGAAICIEIWHPAKWIEHLETEMPSFGELFESITS